MIQKQIQTQPGGANILSQLSHIPATIKIHQTTPIISHTPATTVTSAPSLSRLGKSVFIVQQQGVLLPPQAQVTPTVMKTQTVQHTGTQLPTKASQETSGFIFKIIKYKIKYKSKLDICYNLL